MIGNFWCSKGEAITQLAGSDCDGDDVAAIAMNARFIKFLKETLAALGSLPLQEASQVADLVDDQDKSHLAMRAVATR